MGVALSGGGSRAALFGSAGLEALTRLRTPDGDLLTTAAAKLVEQHRGDILGFLAGTPPPPR